MLEKLIKKFSETEFGGMEDFYYKLNDENSKIPVSFGEFDLR